MAGYSGTPLAKKLGYKAGFRAYVKNGPADYDALVAPLPDGVQLLTRPGKDLDLIHFFTDRRATLASQIDGLVKRLKPNGALWISWPKKASKVPTDVTEDVIRDVILPRGLVDVKVCAVDEVWSGLKVVLRKELR